MKWVILAVVSGIIICIGLVYFIGPKSIEVYPEQTVEESSQQIKLVLVGDIMLERGVKHMMDKYGSGDYKFPFLEIADYLKEADVVFANLEGPISDKGTKVGSIYSFRNDPEAIEGLEFAGFNVISLANNHAFDYGRQALEDSLTWLNDAGIDYVGAGFSENQAYSPVIKEIKDTKIAFLAYTNLGPETWRASGDNSGIAWVDESDFERIGEEIKSAKEESDVLVVSLHAGEEYQETPTQFQIDFAKMAIESGADLVIGHHPHVVQLDGTYLKGYIFYSLGNFIFDQNFSEETMRSESAEVIIENKKIEGIDTREIRINEYFQPELL